MRVSLVVATINRIEPLRRLLKSLETQRHRDFTLFLADQNPFGYLDEVFSEFARLPIAVTRMLPRGVSAARNSVLTQADGDIIAFPDDDCLYEPDTLSQVVQFFSRHQQYGGVSGSLVGYRNRTVQVKIPFEHPTHDTPQRLSTR